MTWHYQVVKYKRKIGDQEIDTYSVIEVFLNDKGKIFTRDLELDNKNFVYKDVDDLKFELVNILKDLKQFGIRTIEDIDQEIKSIPDKDNPLAQEDGNYIPWD
jgi:hypothetical protein